MNKFEKEGFYFKNNFYKEKISYMIANFVLLSS